MSEAMDKVRGVRELPIFPLPVVLFPGMPMPLHIFEERYRTMLSDIRAGDNLFGLSYFDPSASDKDMPPAGHINVPHDRQRLIINRPSSAPSKNGRLGPSTAGTGFAGAGRTPSGSVGTVVTQRAPCSGSWSSAS